MSVRCFVDTNILMYAHDTAAGLKHERAKTLVQELWNNRSGVVSTQVLQELCVNLQRKLARPLGPQETREIAADYLTWHVVVNDGQSILAALDVQARHPVSFWDALVIQAVQGAGVSTLYSEDLSDGQR
jgi:predicted nucleic acid-binding protein